MLFCLWICNSGRPQKFKIYKNLLREMYRKSPFENMNMMNGYVLWILLYLVPMLVAVSGTLESKYIKTQVHEEENSCKHDDYSRASLIMETMVFSRIKCSLLCTADDKCRRFMFDVDTKFCSLFESGENCMAFENIDSKLCFRQKSICDETRCVRCPVGYYGNQCQHIIQDCSDLDNYDNPETTILSYIQPLNTVPPVEVKCDFRWRGLTVIHYRRTSCREVDFNRSWEEYADGFGTSLGNYWLGLETVYNILQNAPRFGLTVFLKVSGVLGNPKGHYSRFNISDRSLNYAITILSFLNDNSVGSGNSLSGSGYDINGRPFSTYDRDHTSHNCPDRFHGGWWYLDDAECSRANLNGRRSGSSFQETWHWQDKFGNTTDFKTMMMYLSRINVPL